MKAVISKETVLVYLDLSKRFTTHTGASDMQLGALIMQEGKALEFSSKKRSKAQLNYTVTEDKIPSTEKLLKSLKKPLGTWNQGFTDHKNLTYETI